MNHPHPTISAETNVIIFVILLISTAVVLVCCRPVREGPRRTLYTWLQLSLFVVTAAALTAAVCYAYYLTFP